MRQGMSRMRWAVGLGTLAAVMAAAPAIAGGPPGKTVNTRSGNVGVHTLIDNAEYPGVRCVYGLDFPVYDPYVLKIRIRRPIVFAFDRRPGVEDSQRVGWRYLILAANNGDADWTVAYTSDTQYAKATDQHNAPFTPRTYVPPDPPAAKDWYDVRIQLFWYRHGVKDGSWDGAVKNYLIDTPYSDYPDHDCFKLYT